MPEKVFEFNVGVKKAIIEKVGYVRLDMLSDICKTRFGNSFSTNISLLYSLETSENRSFFYVFRGYKSGILVENGLM